MYNLQCTISNEALYYLSVVQPYCASQIVHGKW